MTCETVKLPSGVVAVVCGPRARRTKCANCGTLASERRQCDWKIGAGNTCDARLCSACSYSPAPGKDLCPEHAEAWRHHRANRVAAL